MNRVLSEQRRLRLAALTALYFAQGVPLGLISVAVPARLVELGLEAGPIAYFTATATLPWAFKLVAGPLMDRFTFLPMGFRRPWVLLAQAGLVLALLGLAMIGELDPDDLMPLTALAFLVNVFASTQDVAVDGMAIDILPVDERGRANAFMGFGQGAGVAAFGWVGGAALGFAGLPVAALLCAVTVGLIFLFAASVRERPGERLMPWTGGQAAPRRSSFEPTFRSIGSNLCRVLFLPMSLLLILVEFVNRVRDGVAVAVFPVFAINDVGVTLDEYTGFKGIAGLIGATVVVLLGPYIDRIGARLFLLCALAGSALCHFAVALLPDPVGAQLEFIIALGLLSELFTQLIFVTILALFMNLCWREVSATQFAIYMSLANLSRTIGGWAFAPVADLMSTAGHFLLMGGLLAAAGVLLLAFDQDAHARHLALLTTGAGVPGAVGQPASARAAPTALAERRRNLL